MSSCSARFGPLLTLCFVIICCVVDVEASSTSEKKCRTYSQTKVLYRVLRPKDDPLPENCKQGLIAKNTTAKKTLQDHVANGSKKDYKSQYISTGTNLRVLEERLKKNKSSRKIVCITAADVKKAGCTVYDFNVAAVMKKHLKTKKAQNYARALCEVVLKCKRRLDCKYVDDVKKETSTGGEITTTTPSMDK